MTTTSIQTASIDEWRGEVGGVGAVATESAFVRDSGGNIIGEIVNRYDRSKPSNCQFYIGVFFDNELHEVGGLFTKLGAALDELIAEYNHTAAERADGITETTK